MIEVQMSRNIKNAVAFMFAALLAFIINNVYSIYSHGVSSPAMSSTWMLLLFFGTGFYLMMELVSVKINKQLPGRLSLNLYNSGIAAFSVGMMIQGVLEIAGSGFDYLIYFYIMGIVLMTAGIATMNIKKP